jgi:hypothetical protein
MADGEPGELAEEGDPPPREGLADADGGIELASADTDLYETVGAGHS